MPDDVTVEGIQIVISQESTNAVSGIENLVKHLQELKSVTTGGLKGLTTISKQLERFNTALSAMPNLSKFEQLRDILAQIKGIGNIDISSIVRNSNLSGMASPVQDSSLTDNLRSGIIDIKPTDNIDLGTDEWDNYEETVKLVLDDISDPIERLRKQIELQKIRVEDLGMAYARLKSEAGGVDSDATASAGLSYINAQNQLERYEAKLKEVEQTYKAFADAASSTIEKTNSPMERMRMQIDLQKQTVESLAQKYEELKATTGLTASETISAGNAFIAAQNRLDGYREKLISLARESGFTREEIRKLADEIEYSGDIAKRGSSGFSKLFSSFKRIATYRAIRAVIRAISKAFQTGLQNIAQYSEEANKTLSELKTVSTQLSNSIAAGAMPTIEALTPVLVALGNAAIFVVNGFNALTSLLTGKTTMTIATSQWQDYADSVNEAKKAVTGFDELNKLGDSSTSSFAFEEVDIDFGDFAGALATLAALGAGFTALLALLKDGKFLTNWKSFGGILMTVAGTLGSIVSMVSIINNGATWLNTIGLIGSLALAVGGLALKFGTVGTKIGLVIAAIALLVTAIVDMVQNGITIENVTLVVAGLTAAVIACGLQFGAVGASIALIIGNIITLVLGVIKYIQEWGNMSLWQKIVSGILLVASAACAVWAIAEAIKGNYVMAGVAAAIGIGVAVGGVAVIDCFAEGGFPVDGQLFIANEAGAEMVGSIGGHTAVANNADIIAGIKQGVYEAMQESDGGNGGDWVIQIVDPNGRIKGSDIITAAQRKNIRDGKTTIKLGI